MSFFSPVVSFLRKAIAELSKADGKEGLSPEDIALVVARVRSVNKAMPTARGLAKLEEVTAYVESAFGLKIPKLVSVVIAVLCYFIHKRTK